MGPWKEREFSLPNQDLGPELLLNGKYLDQYRYPTHMAFLYHNLTEIMTKNMTWQGVFDLEEIEYSEVELSLIEYLSTYFEIQADK